MAQFSLPYGKSTLKFNLADSLDVTTLSPAEVAPAPNPQQLVAGALDHPVGGRSLSDFAGVNSVAIAINDKTRPVPHQYLLPPLLERLEQLGVPPQAITLLIATGAHPPVDASEFGQVVPPEILARYPVICHDAEEQANLEFIGETSRGTPLWLNRKFIQADLRVVVGNLEPHQFMGFSGGVKSAVIGLGGKATINVNHALMTDPQALLGQYEQNPARQDVEEMGELVGIHFALNAILNDHKQLVEVLAGEPRAVMAAGIPRVRALYQVSISQPFDFVIASPGGHPKDINVYQTQKGLAHAALVTKPGGTILLVAACPEGAGSDKYEKWMQDKYSYQDIFDGFEADGFRVGPHKAFQIARDASRVNLLLVSDMPPSFARGLLLNPVRDLQEGLSMALNRLPARAKIGIMPLANATIPVLHSGQQ
jgi:nickel-dependent lactate racemase